MLDKTLDVFKLRELLEETHGSRAMVYKDLFALGCWFHLNDKRAVGEKMIKEVIASVPAAGNRTYLASIAKQIAGNEGAWAAEIFAHQEVNDLFDSAAAYADRALAARYNAPSSHSLDAGGEHGRPE